VFRRGLDRSDGGEQSLALDEVEASLDLGAGLRIDAPENVNRVDQFTQVGDAVVRG
jgi:hypothetical protein